MKALTSCISAVVVFAAISSPALANSPLSMDEISKWEVTSTQLLQSSDAFEGTGSLKFQSGGYAAIKSVTFEYPEKINAILLSIKKETTPSDYNGLYQAYLSCPSLNIYNYLVGEYQLSNLPSKEYATVELAISDKTVNAQLQGGCEDLSLSLNFNSSSNIGDIFIDNVILNLPTGLERHAEIYSKSYKVKKEEALKRLTRQATVGKLNAALAILDNPYFSGVSITHRPQYSIEILVKDDDSRDAEKALKKIKSISRKYDIETPINFKKVKYSLEELNNLANYIGDISGSFGVKTDIVVSVRNNNLQIDTTDKSLLRNVLDRKHIDLPAGSSIRQFDSLQILELYAGLEIEGDGTTSDGKPGRGRCTTAFAVKHNITGEKGILTAAHCDNKLTDIEFQGGDIVVKDKAYYGQYDVMWFTVPSDEPENKVRLGFTFLGFGEKSLEIESITPSEEQQEGDIVCKYGVATGLTCGELSGTLVYGSLDLPNRTPGFRRVIGDDDDLSEQGDSGGPWFIGSTAYGVHHGGRDNLATYMPIDNIDVLNVSLITK